ncbi:MAG: NADP-dependent oxidoreductase [Pseudomonadota bacterium]
MNQITSKEWALAKRPVGEPTSADFAMKTVDVPEPKDGEIQVRNTWMSVDPYMRGRMMDRESYVPPFQIGETMQGGAVGRVIASANPNFSEGDLVSSMAGWREAWTADPSMAMAMKLPETGLPESAFLGIAGMPGLTAYSGLLEIGQPKEGETVFVSGAAGAVGATVCQIAKIKGCRIVGSAGGPEKGQFLKEIGVDEVIDYRAHGDADALTKALSEAAPKGIDVYFDNVGGDHLQAALNIANQGARFALCGMISQYNDTTPRPGPNNLILAVGKSLLLQGFIVTNYAHLQPQFIQDMAGWIQSGKMQFRETVMEGVEQAPDAFMGLFKGQNLGKMLVKLA